MTIKTACTKIGLSEEEAKAIDALGNSELNKMARSYARVMDTDAGTPAVKQGAQAKVRAKLAQLQPSPIAPAAAPQATPPAPAAPPTPGPTPTQQTQPVDVQAIVAAAVQQALASVQPQQAAKEEPKTEEPEAKAAPLTRPAPPTTAEPPKRFTWSNKHVPQVEYTTKDGKTAKANHACLTAIEESQDGSQLWATSTKGRRSVSMPLEELETLLTSQWVDWLSQTIAAVKADWQAGKSQPTS